MSDLAKEPDVAAGVIIETDRAKRHRGVPCAASRFRIGGSARSARRRRNQYPLIVGLNREPTLNAQQPGWRVRVIPTSSTAPAVEGSLNKPGDGIYTCINGVGRHEVIIDASHHEPSMSAALVDEQSSKSVVYREPAGRFSNATRRLVHGLIFKDVVALPGPLALEQQPFAAHRDPGPSPSRSGRNTGPRSLQQPRVRCIYC